MCGPCHIEPLAAEARPVRSRGHRVKPGVLRGAQGGNISRPGSSSRGDARISRDDRQSPKESTAGSAGTLAEAVPATLTRVFETLGCRLFRDPGLAPVG